MSGVALRGSAGPEEFARRLATVRKMCGVKGWDSYDGDPVSDESWERARSIAADLASRGIPWAMLYPSNDGGAVLEWDAGPWAISLEIETSGKVFIVATDCSHVDRSVDAETTVGGAAEMFVVLMRQAGIGWDE